MWGGKKKKSVLHENSLMQEGIVQNTDANLPIQAPFDTYSPPPLFY